MPKPEPLDLDVDEGISWENWLASLPKSTRAALQACAIDSTKPAKPTRRSVPDGAYLTLRETARLLRVSQGKVLGWIKRGRIKAIDVGRAGRPAYRIDRVGLANSLQAPSEPHKQKRRPRTPPGFVERY